MRRKLLKKKIVKSVTSKVAAKEAKPSKDKTTLEAGFSVKKIGLHNLMPPKGSRRHKKILGRGPSSGHGKTSTRGSKGQTSRSGRDFYAGFEGGQTPLIRRIPKRGFTNKFKKEYQIVNLSDLKDLKVTLIDPALLEEQGLIKDKTKAVKILGDGEIVNPVTIQAHSFSKAAAGKVKKIGGKTELINAN